MTNINLAKAQYLKMLKDAMWPEQLKNIYADLGGDKNDRSKQ